ncbi:type I-E CRISPR-associated endonuclease Cas1 [Corynebacterium lizhenjunii]|uniref:CRISPR-associated endonuclease Cas1 n=1 Tax=Corynebacterium lizhenjunii TaxID=2709394 RepID=A0A7T0PAA7_9CORY|nr:type I-E CRISPR-associated endonuclease Cas1e [Corynebacterium lizhenjunii]QPK78811.1 type I-E CRISPR-associated endonuclease Cas1 [Corynebacterium lizhenjunii]
MSRGPGSVPVDRLELSRISTRISFLYVERATISRDNNALTILDEKGVYHVPATSLAALLLGPGTSASYAAMALLGDCGVSVVWVGEKGVRYYAHGRSPAKTSRMAEAQAKLVSNQRTRLRCARRMYEMRFPDEDVSTLSLAQLRGREGARMKQLYKRFADAHGVYWDRRRYDPQDFESSDLINKMLTAANAALYGVVHAVIVALGFVPALGVVHNGTDRALVYDIADLYKADISIPAAFQAAANPSGDPSAQVRRLVRDCVVERRLLVRIVKDLYALMEVDEDPESIDVELLLWNELENIAAGRNWHNLEGSHP